MTMTTAFNTRTDNIEDPAKNSSYKIQPTRKVEYLTIVEKANNPNVGPGSYDTSKPMLHATKNTDWSLQPERFKDESHKRNNSLNYQQDQ